MSQFFKALEQAERDRQREEEAAAQSAAHESRTAPPENGRPAAEPVVEASPASPPPTVGPVASPRVVQSPLPSPAPAREAPAPVRSSKPLVRQPAAAEPAAPKPASAEPAAPKPASAEPAVPKPASAEPAVPKPAATTSPAPPPRVPARSHAASPPAAHAAPPAVDAPSPASVYRPSLGKARRPGLLRRLRRSQPVLVAQTDPNSIEADAYRTLRAKIELMSDNGAFRHIAITSAAGGDGKSTTAANLAVVAAQSGRRVCLIDADLRRPTLHEMFGLRNVDGLSFALEHGKPLSVVAKAADIPNLSVVVAGRGAKETFRDVVTPQRLEKVLSDSHGVFDLVIFDTPPVTAVADAVNVAAVCDGVILVVRPGTIPLSVLRRAADQVKQVKGRVLGVLLNQVDAHGADGESYGYYRAYYTTRSES